MDRIWRIFIFPGKVYGEMDEDPSLIVPLLTLAIVGSIFSGLMPYVTPDAVYIVALQESQEFTQGLLGNLENNGESITAEQEVSSPTPEEIQNLRITSSVTTPIGYLIGLAISAVVLATYFLIFGKAVKSTKDWSDWFAFSLWSFLPGAAALIVSCLITMIAGVASTESAQYLAPLTWLGWESGFAVAISIPLLWSVYIQIEGFKVWTEKSYAISAIAALIPFLFYVGVVGTAMNFFMNLMSAFGG